MQEERGSGVRGVQGVVLPEPGTQVTVGDQLVTVLAATPNLTGADLVFRRGDGTLGEASLDMWGRWMQCAVPRIRSAVLATRPLRPYAHQDEAVFTHMLAQPRLRFLLADEPGIGKTIITGMYLAEGTRRGLIPGRTVIVVPAHLVEKWRRDLRRYFAVEADRLTPELARDHKDLDPRVNVWVVSVDLYTYNNDVRRKAAGARASWSLAVFDEAHRLTPTSQYLSAARELSALLLLTATPHRGKEHYFRGLLSLLDPTLYPWYPRQVEYESASRPSTLSFLRRMKEELKDFEGRDLFPPRYAETITVELTGPEEAVYVAVMDYVDAFYGADTTLAQSIYGKRAASSIVAATATIRRREEALRGAGHRPYRRTDARGVHHQPGSSRPSPATVPRTSQGCRHRYPRRPPAVHPGPHPSHRRRAARRDRSQSAGIGSAGSSRGRRLLSPGPEPAAHTSWIGDAKGKRMALWRERAKPVPTLRGRRSRRKRKAVGHTQQSARQHQGARR